MSEDKPMTVGELEIFDEFCEFPEPKWIPFNLEVSFVYICKLRKLPKARVWNGSEWLSIGIRDHIIGIINLIEETNNE